MEFVVHVQTKSKRRGRGKKRKKKNHFTTQTPKQCQSNAHLALNPLYLSSSLSLLGAFACPSAAGVRVGQGGG